jgi:triacylglycerol lipase
VLTLRAFVEAVLEYTKAPYVNLISHSMGVTLARKIAQGGKAIDHKEGEYEVGPSLKHRIRNFIGIAGGNQGLTACFNLQAVPTCSSIDGFSPGELPTSGPSKYVKSLNANPGAEAMNVYTVWSLFDTVIGGECVVWGKVTTRIPGQKA